MIGSLPKYHPLWDLPQKHTQKCILKDKQEAKRIQELASSRHLGCALNC